MANLTPTYSGCYIKDLPRISVWFVASAFFSLKMIVLTGPFILWLKVIQIEAFQDISEGIQSLNLSCLAWFETDIS